MKKERYLIFKNGFEIRKHNKKTVLIEQGDLYYLIIKNYTGDNKLICRASNKRGLAEMMMKFTKKGLEDILGAFIEYQKTKK